METFLSFVKSAAIESIWELYFLKSLVYLHLTNCKIVDIHPLKFCTNLKFLDFQKNFRVSIANSDTLKWLGQF
ncbi:Leucine-rich_repeat domain superfamily [Hexamita inflata]|uniref:Leucine-rich repeat domain superfamily n=1 Tax=Hexamita inflata TaxID=28002 RepID=A0AA86P6V6_9EUKA|nr:Leucine-rich repeat domain superfamily [Hexamita inflata]